MGGDGYDGRAGDGRWRVGWLEPLGLEGVLSCLRRGAGLGLIVQVRGSRSGNLRGEVPGEAVVGSCEVGFRRLGHMGRGPRCGLRAL